MKTGIITGLVALLLAGITAPAPAGAKDLAIPRLGSDSWVDVDGDRRPDHVTLVDLGIRTRVMIRTAAGRLSAINVAYDDNQGGLPLAQRLVGAAPVDGRNGVELVLFTVRGDCGHYEVITWRRGALTRLAAPRGLSWGACFLGSAPFGEGYTRRIRGGDVQLVHLGGRYSKGKVALRRQVFVWRNNGWIRPSTSRSRVKPRKAYGYWRLALAWVTSSSRPLLGDINGDRVVGCLDQAILTRDWGTDLRRSDLNGDGLVNVQDMSILVSHWTGPRACGATTAAVAVQKQAWRPSRVPGGVTYLMRRDPFGFAYGYRFTRNGRHARFAWSYTAGAPGCFRGRMVKNVARGVHASLYPDETNRDRRVYTLQARSRYWRVDGEKYRVVPATARVAIFLDSVYERCRDYWKGRR